jgi:DNA polymerase-3 subunit delta
VAELKPVYLIHGDDYGAVAERRAGLRALAESQGSGAAIEVLEGDAATPPGVAAALAAMTLALGRRVIIVDGVERWREADVDEHLAPALKEIPPETTLALFAREEARAKAPDSLHDAVKRARGQVVAQLTVRPWELPKWVREQGARLGLALDAAAAKALVGQVGERQQRLLRELEKLALELDVRPAGAVSGGGAGAGGAPVPVDAAEIEQRAARSAERRGYALADALVAGDGARATALLLELRDQGERPAGLTYLIAARLREAIVVATRLADGEPPAQIKRDLRMPARAADRLIADVSRGDPERLRFALVTLAQLELDARGGAPIAARRSTAAGMDEDTLALRAVQAIAG